MKRESGRNPTHRFSLGERFDETPMKIYYISYQYIRLSNHQFIGFSSLIKSAVGTAALSQPVAYMRTCNHAGTAARDTIRGWQKEKQRQANITAIGF